MTEYQNIKSDFLERIENHRIEVLLDNELYRHLRFKQPKTNSYWFDIITWPGNLCIRGDMGCYAFARIEDMFEFFVSETRDPLFINPCYWAEKLQAINGNGLGDYSIKEFSAKLFNENVRSILAQYLRYNDLSRDQKKTLIQEVKEEILTLPEGSDQHDTICDALDFSFEGEYIFQDLWDYNCTQYKYHYIWCLYAIVWGIQQYVASKKKEAA